MTSTNLEQEIEALEKEIAVVASKADELDYQYQLLSDKILQKKRQLQMKTNFEKE